MDLKHPPLARSLAYLLFGLCPLLFFTDVTRNPYYTQITLLNVFVCALWIVWLCQAWQAREFVMVTTPLERSLAILFGILFLSWIVSFWQHPAFTLSIYSEGSKAMVFLIINTYLVYAAAVRFRDPVFVRRLVLIVYVVTTFASVYGMAQYFGVEWFWPQQLSPYGSRPVSTFGNPNFMSSYLAVMMPVAFADYFYGFTGTPRALVFLVFMSALGALLATLTRSSWAGLFVGLLVTSAGIGLAEWRRPAVRRSLAVFAAAVLVMLVFWPKSGGGGYSATVFERLTEVVAVKKGIYPPVSQRLLIWLSSWEMVLDHPLFGKGWGCFELFYPFYQGALLLSGPFSQLRTHANNCHNEILEYWTQAGSLGLGAILLVWIVFFRFALSVARRLAWPARAFFWGLVGGVAAMLVDNLLNVSVHFAVPAFLFWWWVGLAMATDSNALSAYRWRLEGGKARGVAAVAIGALLLLGVRAGCLWAGEVHFFKGFKLSKGNANLNGARAELEKAYGWHHLEVNNNYELGNVYARLGDPARALAMYQRATEANAGYDEIYFNRGTVLMQAGQIEPAIDFYKKTLAINPVSHDAYNALAGLYLKDLARYGDAAETLYRQAVQAFPGDKDMWNNLGYLLTQRKKFEDAYQAYRHALVIDPEFDLAWRNLRTVAKDTQGHAEDPILNLDRIYADLDRLIAAREWPEAQKRLAPVVAALPNSFRARFYEGNIAFGLGDYAAAAAAYEFAVKRRPDSSTSWQNLAVSYEKLGKLQEAQAAYRKTLELDPNSALARQRVGQ
jgi:tetratricopeptide (TPR) repeat protein/O-antigen ligase